MSLGDELLIPEPAKRDPTSIEIMRVWIADDNQHFTLRGDIWDDPAAWGLLLADLARNLATSYCQDAAIPAEEALARIKDAFTVELENPTDT